MPIATIEQRIQEAPDEDRVVEVIRNYIATILPSDLMGLPADCRVDSISTAEEIAETAVALRTCELKMSSADPARPLVSEMTKLFVFASRRVARLRDPLAMR